MNEALIKRREEDVDELDTLKQEMIPVDQTMMALVKLAQMYPRNVRKCLDEAITNCCLNEEIAGSCTYSVPRGGGFIKGASIRQAEIMASAWGRMVISGQEIRSDDHFVYCEGKCIDVQKMIGWSITKKKALVSKKPDMIANISNGCVSIAVRDAIFRTIGIAFRDEVYREALTVATGGKLPIEERRRNALTTFTKMGISEERVLARFDRSSVDEISDDDLITLIGLRMAIKEGETTIEEAFPIKPDTTKPPITQSTPATKPASPGSIPTPPAPPGDMFGAPPLPSGASMPR